MLNLYFVYSFIKKLVTPFSEWKACKSGVIDEKGDVKVLAKDRTQDQKDSYSAFDRLVLKIKKMLAKIPGGNLKLASYAAALYLIKETRVFHGKTLNEDTLYESIDMDKLMTFVIEEMTTSDAIAPLLDPNNVSKEAQKKHVKRNRSKKNDPVVEEDGDMDCGCK